MGDIRDNAKLNEILGTYNFVGIFHAAALKSVANSKHNKEEYMEVNFHSTRNLFDLAKKHEI